MDEEAGHRYMVARVLERYDVPGLGDELVQRWTAEGTERASLRELARFTNERLVAAAMANNNSTIVIPTVRRSTASPEAVVGTRAITDRLSGGSPAGGPPP